MLRVSLKQKLKEKKNERFLRRKVLFGTVWTITVRSFHTPSRKWLQFDERLRVIPAPFKILIQLHCSVEESAMFQEKIRLHHTARKISSISLRRSVASQLSRRDLMPTILTVSDPLVAEPCRSTDVARFGDEILRERVNVPQKETLHWSHEAGYQNPVVSFR